MRANAASLTNINKLQAKLRQGGCRYIAILLFTTKSCHVYISIIRSVNHEYFSARYRYAHIPQSPAHPATE